jgi:hypothetical protein
VSDISKILGIFFPQIFNITKLGKEGKKILNFKKKLKKKKKKTPPLVVT